MNDIRPVIKKKATELGFQVCRFTTAELPTITGTRLGEAIEANRHASMDWLQTTFDRRKTPKGMWPEAKSAILLGLNYGPEIDPLDVLNMRNKAAISVYAQNRDYHDLIKGRLKQIAGWVAAKTGRDVKVFVDTAPLMEKPLAEQSGIGWQGKHTNLVSREFGSWLFLGAILTTAEFEADPSEEDHCGSCHACLDVCPTDAFPAPYLLDARRCISYLTIEHKGPIALEFRELMGNRIFGCDDCLAVCPWNKYARTTSEAKLAAREDLSAPDLAELAELDDTGFRTKFSGSPIKRIGRNRFMRNVLLGMGNSGDRGLANSATPHLEDPDPLVRGSAVWALSHLMDHDSFEALKTQAQTRETDASVVKEWRGEAE